MKKFIKNLLLFSSIIVLFFAIVRLNTDKKTDPKTDYMAAMIDKHHRLESIKTPKIIFSGGSNLAFGLDSEIIEQEFSIPVVNLGLHAGLGFDFILEELKASIQENDIVFVSIEYLLDAEGEYKLKKHTSSLYPPADSYFTSRYRDDFYAYMDDSQERLKQFLKKKKKKKENETEIGIYSRPGFDRYGDVVSHLDKTPPGTLSDGAVLRYRYWDLIEKLNAFNTFAKTKNVSVFYLFPNYTASEYKKNSKVIAEVYADLQKDLEFDIVGKPDDFIFDDSLFFDTVYHLNKEGRELRTQKLKQALRDNAAVQAAFAKRKALQPQ